MGKLLCIDTSQVELYGDYDEIEGSQLIISLARCNDYDARNNCIKDEDIDMQDWLDDRYFAILYNERKFDKTKDAGQRSVPQSTLKWVPISNQIR